MGTKTAIEWCHHTFNPWIGCSKVHEGCTHCYAEADMDKRRGRVKWGPSGTRSRTSEANWKLPLKWNKKAAEAFSDYNRGAWEDREAGYHGQASDPPERPRVFCASLADVFEDWDGPILLGDGRLFINPDGEQMLCEPERPRPPSGSRWFTMDDCRVDLFRLIDSTPNLDWLVLTKRPENVRRMIPNVECVHCGEVTCPPHKTGVLDNRQRDNLWLGTSVSTQESADKLIPALLRCRDLAAKLFVSVEPLLGPIDLMKIGNGAPEDLRA